MSKAKQLMDVIMYVNAKGALPLKKWPMNSAFPFARRIGILPRSAIWAFPYIRSKGGTGIPYIEEPRSSSDPVR